MLTKPLQILYLTLESKPTRLELKRQLWSIYQSVPCSTISEFIAVSMQGFIVGMVLYWPVWCASFILFPGQSPQAQRTKDLGPAQGDASIGYRATIRLATGRRHDKHYGAFDMPNIMNCAKTLDGTPTDCGQDHWIPFSQFLLRVEDFCRGKELNKNIKPGEDRHKSYNVFMTNQKHTDDIAGKMQRTSDVSSMFHLQP